MPIVYTREQLIELRTAVVFPGTDTKSRSCYERHAVAVALGQIRRFRPVPLLPSLIMGNLRSSPIKMDELAALMRYQKEYRENSIFLFMESWLTPLNPEYIRFVAQFPPSAGRQNSGER